jgi:hypothetical protein
MSHISRYIRHTDEYVSFVNFVSACAIVGCIAMPLRPMRNRSTATNNPSAAAVTGAPEHSGRNHNLMDRWWCDQKCDKTYQVPIVKASNHFNKYKRKAYKEIADAINIYNEHEVRP